MLFYLLILLAQLLRNLSRPNSIVISTSNQCCTNYNSNQSRTNLLDEPATPNSIVIRARCVQPVLLLQGYLAHRKQPAPRTLQ